MYRKIKEAEKSPFVLVINILFSIMVLFQFIVLFLGRWFDLVSFGMNIVFVVAGWMIYANGFAKNKPICFSGFGCIRAWSMCKVVLQGLVMLMLLINGIVLIVNGADFESPIMIISGILAIIFGIAMRVFMMLFFIKLFSFMGKRINILKNQVVDIFISAKYKIWLILLASLEGVKLLATLLGAATLGPAISYRWSNLYDIEEWIYGYRYSHSYLDVIGDSFSVGSAVMLFFISGLSIAICIVGIFAVKKFLYIRNESV